ncbi:MAG: zinc ABC transporter substrate-binding protein [Dehalococcoidia bacterium]|nr:zinc ABC transporter substrate-binding protein [Dehalococcoidia bacterium]
MHKGIPRHFAVTGRVAMLAIALMLLAVACASDEGNGAADNDTGKLKVVSTVSPITSLVENIGGTRIDLEGVVPEGVNSHTFEPAPSVAAILSEADLFIANGLFLEEPTIEMARANKKAGAVIVTLGDKAVTREEWVFDFSFPSEDGHPNPHLWTSPPLALRYAELIRDELAALDPDNASYYDENLATLTERINDLDGRIVEAVATVPPENKKLLTYHDSFPYFGPRYGFEIIGAVQPSDFTEPSAREVAQLIEQIRASDVPAIFGSEVFPSPVMQQIANEGGAEFVDQLRDDDLPGAPGDPRHTYLGLILTDVEIIVTALGGSTDALEGFDPSLVFEGDSGARYPQ